MTWSNSWTNRCHRRPGRRARLLQIGGALAAAAALVSIFAAYLAPDFVLAAASVSVFCN